MRVKHDYISQNPDAFYVVENKYMWESKYGKDILKEKPGRNKFYGPFPTGVAGVEFGEKYWAPAQKNT